MQKKPTTRRRRGEQILRSRRILRMNSCYDDAPFIKSYRPGFVELVDRRAGEGGRCGGGNEPKSKAETTKIEHTQSQASASEPVAVVIRISSTQRSAAILEVWAENPKNQTLFESYEQTDVPSSAPRKSGIFSELD